MGIALLPWERLPAWLLGPLMTALGVFLLFDAEPYSWRQLEAILFSVAGIGVFVYGLKKLRAIKAPDAEITKNQASDRIPFPENMPGDFYVEEGCCTSCGMPSTVAPELFAYAPDGHCYVCKQPSNAIEDQQMIDAFEVQDIGCIRYKGKNRVIQVKLITSGEGDQCDALNQVLQALNAKVKADRWGK